MLLMLTLLTARTTGHLERARARALLDLVTPAPSHPDGFWHRLVDGADWRTTLYSVLLLPSAS